MTQVLTLKDAVHLIAQRGRLIAEKCEAEAPSDGSVPTDTAGGYRTGGQCRSAIQRLLCFRENCVIVEMDLHPAVSELIAVSRSFAKTVAKTHQPQDIRWSGKDVKSSVYTKVSSPSRQLCQVGTMAALFAPEQAGIEPSPWMTCPPHQAPKPSSTAAVAKFPSSCRRWRKRWKRQRWRPLISPWLLWMVQRWRSSAAARRWWTRQRNHMGAGLLYQGFSSWVVGIIWEHAKVLNYPSGRKKIEKDHLLECIAYIFQSCCAEQYTPFLFLAANDCLVLSTTNTNHPCVFLKSCICIYIYVLCTM